MKRLAFADVSYTNLANALTLAEEETCSLLLASPTSTLIDQSNLLVREIQPVPDQAYAIRTAMQAQLRPEFLVPLIQRARQEHLSVVFVHTHPFAEGTPVFSPMDDEGEKHLADFLSR